MQTDNLRGFSIHKENTDEAELAVPIEFPVQAQVYSLQIKCWGTESPGTVTLKLKDSTMVVSELHDFAASFPNGMAWSDSARLLIPPGVTASLMLTYGKCR